MSEKSRPTGQSASDSPQTRAETAEADERTKVWVPHRRQVGWLVGAVVRLAFLARRGGGAHNHGGSESRKRIGAAR